MSDSDSDESLDLTSEKFNPLKALYSRKVVLPFPGAKTLDNLSKYESHVLKGMPLQGHKKKKDESRLPRALPVRRFLPHQMPVRGRGRRSRSLRNVLTHMEGDGPAGPLSVLSRCIQHELRVKIYTRHISGIRGFVEANIVAFDKHWNIALKDVREVWVRRRRPRVPALGDGDKPVSKRSLQKGGARPPQVISAPLKKGEERCERYVGQLLIRGEQVVLVAVLNYCSLVKSPSAKGKGKVAPEETATGPEPGPSGTASTSKPPKYAPVASSSKAAPSSKQPADTPATSCSKQPNDAPATSSSKYPKDPAAVSFSKQPADTPAASCSKQPNDAPATSSSKYPKDPAAVSFSKQPADTPATYCSKQPNDAPATSSSKYPKDPAAVSFSKQPADTPATSCSKQPNDAPATSSSKYPKNLTAVSSSKQHADTPAESSLKQPNDVPAASFSKYPKEALAASSSNYPKDGAAASSSRQPEGTPAASSLKQPDDAPAASSLKLHKDAPAASSSKLPKDAPGCGRFKAAETCFCCAHTQSAGGH